jgi:hypothetical protein
MSSRRQTPLVCPICGASLKNIQITSLGQVTAGLPWEMHAGRCEEHGWFQAEMISKPPREIFAVSRPGGIARKVLIDGQPVYAFPTVWDSIGGRRPVDPYDQEMWVVDWSRLPVRKEITLTST